VSQLQKSGAVMVQRSAPEAKKRNKNTPVTTEDEEETQGAVVAAEEG